MNIPIILCLGFAALMFLSFLIALFDAHIRVIDNRETLEVLTERRETNRRDAIEAEAVLRSNLFGYLYELR